MVRRMSGCRHGNHIARAGYWIGLPKNGITVSVKRETLRLQRCEQCFWRPGRMRPFGLIDQDLATREFAQPIHMVNMKMGHDDAQAPSPAGANQGKLLANLLARFEGESTELPREPSVESSQRIEVTRPQQTAA